MRLAFAAVLLLVPGCGAGLSGPSQQMAGQASADALFYGAAALARAGRAPTDQQATHTAGGEELETPPNEYACTLGGEERIVRADSRDEALAECGESGCECVDRAMRDELARYAAHPPVE